MRAIQCSWYGGFVPSYALSFNDERKAEAKSDNDNCVWPLADQIKHASLASPMGILARRFIVGQECPTYN